MSNMSAPTNTLAFHMSRPFVQHRDLRNIPCEHIADKMKSYVDNIYDDKSGAGLSVPEEEALTFYGLNHAVGLIAQEHAAFEPLPAEKLALVEAYFRAASAITIRSTYYLILICLRETRHTPYSTKASFKGELASITGSSTAANFLIDLKGKESLSVANSFIQTPPNCSIGALMLGAAHCFYHGGFHGSFGGAKWGAINDVLNRFLSGEFTAEMMLDTVWTLSHNTGPIYNKGMLYTHWDQALKNILDIQRAGLIPTAILEKHPIVNSYVTAELRSQMLTLKNLYPEAIADYVDWYVVEALGAVNNCKKFQQQQLALYGPSKFAEHIEQMKKQKALADAAASEAKKAAFAKDNFEVMPGQFLPKVKAVRAA